jgi:hypothetical protein
MASSNMLVCFIQTELMPIESSKLSPRVLVAHESAVPRGWRLLAFHLLLLSCILLRLCWI